MSTSKITYGENARQTQKCLMASAHLPPHVFQGSVSQDLLPSEQKSKNEMTQEAWSQTILFHKQAV